MRAFWDSQFRFAQLLPDFAECLERMRRESETFAADTHLQRLAYGAHPRQWLEWTAGESPGQQGAPQRVIVVLHGGYWRALRAEDHRFMLAALRPFASTVANVEYRLMPEVRLGDVIADAVSALLTLAQKFPAAKLLPVGHSAGAHLAVAALGEPRIAARVSGVLALSGIYDLRPLAHSFLQDELSLTEAEMNAHSLHPQTARPPVLYVNGAAETHEFLRASALMASTGAAQWRVLPQAHHMSLLWAAMAKAPQLLQLLEEMMEQGARD